MAEENLAGSDRNRAHQNSYRALTTDELEVKESLNDEVKGLKDFDGTEMLLFPCQYTMGNSITINTLVKKGTYRDKLSAELFRHLIGLKHHMLVPVLNYYHRGSDGNGWFVVAPVQGSLEAWMKGDKGDMMFKGIDKKRNMSLMFRNMIINLWDLLCKMYDAEILLVEIKMEDLFVEIMPCDLPRIKLLMTKVRKLVPGGYWEDIWLQIDLLIKKCYEIGGYEIGDLSREFCKYMVHSESINHAKYYPDAWSIDDKACYLYHTISGKAPHKRHVMKSKVNVDSMVEWPEDVTVISLICDLDANNYFEETPNGVRRVCRYDKLTGYSYLKLCRDAHKHFDDLTEEIKDWFYGKRENIIDMMDECDPYIWIKLYEAIGPLGRQLGN